MSKERFPDHLDSLENIIKEKENLINKYNAELESYTSDLSIIPKAESSYNDKLNSLISEKLKVKDELTLKKLELEEVKIKIDRSINCMENLMLQDIISKTYYHKMTAKDLSKIYGVSESHIRNTLTKAKKEFHKEYKKY